MRNRTENRLPVASSPLGALCGTGCLVLACIEVPRPRGCRGLWIPRRPSLLFVEYRLRLLLCEGGVVVYVGSFRGLVGRRDVRRSPSCCRVSARVLARPKDEGSVDTGDSNSLGWW